MIGLTNPFLIFFNDGKGKMTPKSDLFVCLLLFLLLLLLLFLVLLFVDDIVAA